MLQCSVFCLLLLLLQAPVVHGEDTISLAGKWRFSRDKDKVGISQRWFDSNLKTEGTGPTEIALPGTTDQANAGYPNPDKPNLGGLYRPNIYTGPAWYQREINIPDSWRGRHITLFLERNHWTSHVWLDDRDLGTQDSLVSPHIFDLCTGIAPGLHRLTICQDNTLKFDLGTFVSIYYEGTQTNWNGIIGAIELRASDLVAIRDVQIYPDVDRKLIKVKLVLSNLTDASVSGLVHFTVMDATGTSVALLSIPISAVSGDSTVESNIPMGSHPKLWDEFSPNLFTLKSSVETDQPVFHSVALTSFGLRHFATQGTRFTMNGRPLFLRGTLECGSFPLTGCPPTDVASWHRIYRIMNSYGLNLIRFHSWCPPDAAFTAADADGIMIQAEGVQANVNVGENLQRDAFVRQELKRMVDTYGNHPSFCLVSLGNEYGGSKAILHDWIDMLINEDSRHLYGPASCGEANVGNDQWNESYDGQGDSDGRGIRGSDTTHDSSSFIQHLTRPLQGHEIGQWNVFPNVNEISKYTGVLKAENYDLVRDDLNVKGMSDEAHSFFQATGQEARLLYKEEIEVLMRTPNYSGFSLLGLQDYPGQGTALVGILDSFWDSKGLITPEEHKKYFGCTVPLLRLSKRVYAEGETFTAHLDIANFGPTDLNDIKSDWIIADEKGQTLSKGALPSIDLPTGKLTSGGEISTPLQATGTPAKLTVTVSLKGTAFSNSWNIWIYPKPSSVALPHGVVLSHTWDDATRAALEQGKTVVLIPATLNPNQSFGGSFTPVFWSPVWFHDKPGTMGLLCDPKHPLFARFTTDFYTDWQWWNLLQGSQTMVLNDTPALYRPLIQVIDNFARNDKLGDVIETKVGPGRLLVCTLNLKNEQSPEVAEFLRSLYGYVSSKSFHPSTELPATFLDRLLQADSRLLTHKAKVIAFDSQADGFAANNAIDGDTTTFWHTQFSPTAVPLPHFITIDLGADLTLTGITYMPRQDMGSGRAKDCEVYLSDDPRSFTQQPLAAATLQNTSESQTISFRAPATGRYLKFVAKSSQGGEPYIAAAELDIIEK